MSDRRFKKLLFFGFTFYFLFHVSISLLFSFPELFGYSSVQKLVFRYMFPFFNQGNRVFAPDPPLFSHDLKYSFFVDGKWTDWYSMLDSLNEEHLRNRFSPSSTRVKLADYQYLKVYDAILLADYEAEKNEETQAEKRDSIRLRSFASSAAYLNTLRYLKKRELLSKEADSLKFLVLHTYPAQKNSSEVLYPVRSESMAIPLHH